MATSLLFSTSLFRLHYNSYLILVFSFFTVTKFALSQNNCVLDIQYPLSDENSTCKGGGWDGFFNNSCCESTFNGFLYALAKKANETGKIFPTSSEQKECLTSMKGIDRVVFSCGLEKLTSGGGGCSDYSIADVAIILGNDLRKLGRDCEFLGSDNNSNTTCGACSDRLEDIRVSANNSKAQTDVCKFAALITLTSQRVDDVKWVQALYQCLDQGRINLGDQGNLALGKMLVKHTCIRTLDSTVRKFSFTMSKHYFIIVFIAIIIYVVYEQMTRESRKKSLKSLCQVHQF